MVKLVIESVLFLTFCAFLIGYINDLVWSVVKDTPQELWKGLNVAILAALFYFVYNF